MEAKGQVLHCALSQCVFCSLSKDREIIVPVLLLETVDGKQLKVEVYPLCKSSRWTQVESNLSVCPDQTVLFHVES